MDYFWTDCPRCGCQVAVNYTVHPDRVSGSVRRWSSDRSINDGRLFELPASGVGPGGEFSVACVCGQELPAVSQARGEQRLGGLRVNLGERG
jgi:hypothetical protein